MDFACPAVTAGVRRSPHAAGDARVMLAYTPSKRNNRENPSQVIHL